MKKILLLLAIVTLGCSSNDDNDCHKCIATFFSPETRQEFYVESDCNHTPPNEYVVFVSHKKH